MIYYVIKDGRSLSDYTDRKRAEEHAEQVGGYVEEYIEIKEMPTQVAEKYARRSVDSLFFNGKPNLDRENLERLLRDVWLAGWDYCRELVRVDSGIKI